MKKNNSTANGELRRQLNPMSVWAIAFGCIIGWGSFINPGKKFLPNSGVAGTAIAMGLGALVMIIIAFSYAYMVPKYPKAGGEFTFAKKCFGKNAAYICGWFLVAAYLTNVPMNSTAIGLIVDGIDGKADILKFGFHYQIAGFEVYFGEILLAMGILILFGIFNIIGVKKAGFIQTVLAILLAVSVFTLAITALISAKTNNINMKPVWGFDKEAVAVHEVKEDHPDLDEKSKEFKKYVEDYKPESDGTVVNDLLEAESEAAANGEKADNPLNHSGKLGILAAILATFAIAPWAFVGFDTIPQAAEEFNFSYKKVSFIMIVAILFGCFVYVSNNTVAAATIVNWPDRVMAGDWVVLIAAQELLGTFGTVLVGIAVSCAVLSGIMGFYMASSRLMYSMSRDGYLPAFFGKVSPKYGTPVNAMIFCIIISLAGPILGREALGWFVDMSAIGASIGYFFTCAATIVTIKRDKDAKPGLFALAVIGVIFSVAFMVLQLIPIPGLDGVHFGKESYIMLIVWIVLGLIFYLTQVKKFKKEN